MVQTQRPHNVQESAAEYENRLRSHTEGRGVLAVGDTARVADTAAGEQVELEHWRRLSVHEIYDHIRHNFAKKDELDRQARLDKMQDELGVNIETRLPAATVDDLPDRAAQASLPEEQFMHQLAEDIYDALIDAQQSIAAITPESIDSKIVANLRAKGDANFLVTAEQGEHLFTSLQKQDGDFHVVTHNSYGFVLENRELDFRALFVFQDRITESGELIAPSESKEAQTIHPFGTKFPEEQKERLIQEMIALQQKVGRDVEPRTPAEMKNFLDQGLVFLIQGPQGEVIASAYLEPVGDTLFLGGMSSSQTGTLMQPLMGALDHVRDRPIVLRTNPKLGSNYFVPKGFQTATVSELQANHPAIYRAIETKLPANKTTADLDPNLGTFFRE